jgi:hypothetical protein
MDAAVRGEEVQDQREIMIMTTSRLRASIGHVGEALREPEAFTRRWHEAERPYEWWVFLALAVTAITGTTVYGFSMGVLEDWQRMLMCGLSFTVAAGIGWSLPLPALYILNSLSGSRLRASTTFLAALVTTSWGGLALIASVPVNWFFTVAVPVPWFVLGVNLVIFAGVGVAMVDVFSRVIECLEPARGRGPAFWLLLVGIIGGELFYAFDLFRLPIAS